VEHQAEDRYLSAKKRSLSQAERVKEYYKCKNDALYFIENYVQLEEAGGNIYFKMYEPQKKFMKSLINDHHTISLKSRQVGFSTITQAYVVWVFTFNKNVVSAVVSRDGPEATDFCRKILAMLDNLPDWLRPKFPKRSEQTFILDNGCKFYASQVNPKKPGGLFRGKSVNILIIDEAAHIDYIDEAFTGFGPTLVKAQSAAASKNVPYGTIIISTPNKTTGIGKWFFEKWQDAESNPESIYIPHKIHWTQVKEFRDDPNWYKTQCAILHNNHAKIAQELEMKFLASTNSFFDSETVERLNEVAQPPTAKMHIGHNDLNMWERPDPNMFVMIAIDVASASGKDKSVIQVLDFVNFTQVAEWVGKCRVDDFCKVIETVNRIYSRNIMIVENNSYGNQVVEYLTRARANVNIYKQKIKNVEYAAHSRYRYGLSTNAQTRPLIIDSMYTYVKENPNLVRSKYLALELIGLEERQAGRTVKVEAGRGAHDDAAMALGFAAYVRMYDPPLNVATIASQQVVDDIYATIDMNFNPAHQNADISALKYQEEGVTQNRVNQVVQKHVKGNLHKLINESGSNVIDLHNLLGFNPITNERDATYKIQRPGT
jgi:hypothetical protein